MIEQISVFCFADWLAAKCRERDLSREIPSRHSWAPIAFNCLHRYTKSYQPFNIKCRCVYFPGVAVETSLFSWTGKTQTVARSVCPKMVHSRARAKPKTEPAPSLPATATVSAPTIHTEQPSPSEWRSRYPGMAILFGIAFGIVTVLGSWLSAHWSPTVVWRCFDRINEWRYDAGLWPAVEMMAGECVFSDSIPLVSATLQYGKTLPELYRYYEKETAQHRLMLQTAKLPGVHAFYAGAGMGKSTVAAAVLQELYSQGVPAAFVVLDTPGELKRQVATSLQTTSLTSCQMTLQGLWSSCTSVVSMKLYWWLMPSMNMLWLRWIQKQSNCSQRCPGYLVCLSFLCIFLWFVWRVRWKQSNALKRWMADTRSQVVSQQRLVLQCLPALFKATQANCKLQINTTRSGQTKRHIWLS